MTVRLNYDFLKDEWVRRMRDYVYGPWHLWTKKVGAFLLTSCFVSNDEGYFTFR